MKNSTGGYTLSSVIAKTGLSAHVLRVWERRYNAVTPERDKNNRRIYTEQELTKLSILSQLVQLGQSIGKIAHFDEKELTDQLNTLKASNQGMLIGNKVPDGQCETLLRDLYESILCYDMEACYQEMSRALQGFQIDDLMNSVCSPIMKIVGDEWEAGTINVVQEHMVSAALKSILMPQIRSSLDRNSGKSIAFATLQDERHEMGLIFAACMAAARDLRCYYFGSDLPAEILGLALDHIGAPTLAISFVNEISEENASHQISELLKHIPDDCEIWVGGFGTQKFSRSNFPKRCRVLTHAEYVDTLNTYNH